VASYVVTISCAFVATLFNLVFGLALAWVLVRYRFPGRRLVDAIVDLPFALPTAVAGIALTTLFATNGWFGGPLSHLGIKVAYTPLGIIVAMSFTSIPFIVRTVQPVLEELDPALEEAGQTLGASDLSIFASVMLPLLAPALLAGVSLSFARSLGEFGAIIFIAGNQPFSTEITALLAFIRLEEYDYPASAAIASVMLLTAFVMLALTNLMQARALRYTVKG
jgi:sulfate transport system permease protein